MSTIRTTHAATWSSLTVETPTSTLRFKHYVTSGLIEIAMESDDGAEFVLDSEAQLALLDLIAGRNRPAN